MTMNPENIIENPRRYSNFCLFSQIEITNNKNLVSLYKQVLQASFLSI